MQDFYQRYASWPDEKLIQAYRNREDYQPAAITAMEDILRSRGLLAAELQLQSQRSAQQHQQALDEFTNFLTQYEVNTFGAVIDDTAYAAAQLDAGGTYQTFMATLKRRHAWLYIPASLSVASLSLVTFPYDYGRSYNWLRIAGAATLVPLVLVTVLAYRAIRFPIALCVGKDGAVLLVWGRGHNKGVAQAPFAYSFHAGMTEVPNGPRIPTLVCCLEDVHGTKVMIEEKMTIQSSLPPYWLALEQADIRAPGSHRLSVMGGKRPILQRLKKILDGLHAQP